MATFKNPDVRFWPFKNGVFSINIIENNKVNFETYSFKAVYYDDMTETDKIIVKWWFKHHLNNYLSLLCPCPVAIFLLVYFGKCYWNVCSGFGSGLFFGYS